MLSIIIITKNEERLLPILLDSIKEQKFYEKYEIIISDAKSTDKTREIAKSYGCRIVDGGLPSAGRNNGAKAAKGDIILFLDADVMLPPDYLLKNLKDFKKRKLGCATTLYRPLSKRIDDMLIFASWNFCNVFFQLIWAHAWGFCIFARKDIFNKVQGFNEDILIAEDHDFVKRCARAMRFRVLNGPPVFVSVRRLEKEGRLNIVAKYLWGGIYRLFFGEIKKYPFKYELHGGVDLGKISRRKRKV